MRDIHIANVEHQPIEANVRKFLFYRLNNVKGGVGAIVEDTTQGSGIDTKEVGKHLLGHVLRLHNKSDSILHFSISGLGAFWAVIIDITKVK